MHFEVFWQVTPGKFLTNGYPLWCILRYFFRRQPWNFFLHLHPFWCILKYFRTSSLENFWKTDIHFGAFWAIFTSHSRIFFKLTSIFMYFEVFWQVTPVKFLKNGYPFWCILSHFHKPLPDFFLKLTSILMHFEVFWQVTPGKFLTNGYPLWCILRYFFRRQPWKFFWHLHPFWCILKYFWTSSLENKKKLISILVHFLPFSQATPGIFCCWKIDIHFDAFWGILTSHTRKSFEMLMYFRTSPLENI